VPDVLGLAAFGTPTCGVAGAVFTGLGLDIGLLIEAE
jgi:hypothetical protein